MHFTKIIFCFLLAAMLSSSIFLAFAATGKYEVQLQIPIGKTEIITACKEVPTGKTDPVTHTPIMKLTCTGLSDYIVTLYEWLVAAAAILAAAMITWGGFQWLSAAGESKRVEEGKKTMHNALIGLVLALGSYTLLWAINPDLVNFKDFDLSIIKSKQSFLSDGMSGRDFEQSLNEAVNEITQGVFLPGTGISAITQPAGGSTVVPPVGSTGVSVNPDVFTSYLNNGSIIYSCVPSPNNCSCPARDNKTWEKGVAGASEGGVKPIDRRILGAIVLVVKACGSATITAFNETCGHPSDTPTTGHAGGRAVDISGTVCGDVPTACSEKQVLLVKKLGALGYGVGTPNAAKCGGFNDPPNHFHIQV